MSSYTTELMLQEYFMMKYLSSMVAASVGFLSLKILGRGGWTRPCTGTPTTRRAS
jgi:hypothetical protein